MERQPSTSTGNASRTGATQPTVIRKSMHNRWDMSPAPDECAAAIEAVESGGVLYFPRLAFGLTRSQERFLTSAWADGKAKNISFDIATGALAGASGTAADLEGLREMVGRFADSARALITAHFPMYQPQLTITRTSFRTIEASTRATSWRKDDRLLHVDAFPSRPNHGTRILRVFCNVNPREPRVWRVGESFEAVARRFLPGIKPPLPGSARLLAALHVTKSRRTHYDHIMLALHDRMKSDAEYQRTAPQTEVRFAPGSTWICFSDQVSHAARSGQYMLEQTLHLPVDAMSNPSRAPVRVLERLTGHPLV